MSGDIRIRSLRPEEVHQVVGWTSKEGWHVSDNIVGAWYASDPQGFLAAVNTQDQLLGKNFNFNTTCSKHRSFNVAYYYLGIKCYSWEDIPG